jgi:glycosyltransferase involved in cell wall biosynthesis
MRGENPSDPAVAVLIPCFNEEAAIHDVVTGFRAALPDAAIYVYDNNSTDQTIARASDAGAVVRREARQGKGHVVRRMFADVEADIYVLVDGDLTYEAAAAPAMIETLRCEGLDMVTGVRHADHQAAYRSGHRFGNRLLTGFVSTLFRAEVADMLSGYRVFSRRLVKSFPVSSRGFEIETELTVHALELDMAVGDHPTVYLPRPEESKSKLNTFADGFAILLTILRLLQLERPLQVFGGLGLGLMLLAAGFAAPVVLEYFNTGLVPRFPTLIVAASLAVAGLLSLFSGAILSAVAHSRRETRRLFYLMHPAPPAGPPCEDAK